MSYSLALDAPVNASLRRAGVKQLREALKCLQEDFSPPKIHQARKAFKRFRSLLILARPGMAGSAYRAFDHGVRDVARRFAGARDGAAMAQAANQIEAAAVLPAVKSVARAVGAALRAGEAAEPKPIEAREALAQLQRLHADFLSVPIKLDGFPDVAAAAAAAYRDGRRRTDAVGGDMAADDEAVHDWRKSVQRHWRHMQLLSPAWPGLLSEHATLARSLSQHLGDDHDLSVLSGFVTARGAAYGPKRDVAEFLRYCAEAKSSLRAIAHAEARRLFADPPKCFERRLRVYWDTAPQLRQALAAASPEQAPAGLRLVKRG
ncbi:MAG: CHAD domain-containing protein [Hyphomicrobiales bacterium]|nr:CHAD domain-containing protein [Hyphomicrobiales bacterium]